MGEVHPRQVEGAEKAGCPFPDSLLDLGSGNGSCGLRGILASYESIAGPTILHRQEEERLLPALLARSEFASIEEAAPLRRPSREGSIFQQGPRGNMLGSSHPPLSGLRVFEDAALSCRFSWLRPNSGHSSSLVGSSSVTADVCLISILISEETLPVYFGVAGWLRARTLNQMGEPSNPKASRIWLSRNRSKEKCSFTSRSVNRTNVGGATAAWVI